MVGGYWVVQYLASLVQPVQDQWCQGFFWSPLLGLGNSRMAVYTGDFLRHGFGWRRCVHDRAYCGSV